MELKQLFLMVHLHRQRLLIVPYGIETLEEYELEYDGESFNRTLWN